ncbi:MAG: DNA recombination protein RmuC [Gammaproteobacteria bacterium]|jgi:DNA recombination protein RmuC|nr:DNA recombination protein RmuC [Gammaproteobacteria bacterium]
MFLDHWLPELMVALVVGFVLFAYFFSARIAKHFNGHSAVHSEQQKLQLDNARLTSQLQQTQAQLADLQQQQQSLQQQYTEVQNSYSLCREQLAASKAQLQAQIQASSKQAEQLQQSKQEFEDYLKQFAEASLNKQSEQLNTSNKQQLDLILKPLREQLGEFRKRVDHVYTQEAQDRRSLVEQISQLKDLNVRLSTDAINLTKALKGDNKAQGNWGEMVLEKVLEQSGLRNGHEYHSQVNLTQTSGKRLQPDVIVHLPDNKDVIIDAKVSLTAYDRYHSTEDENQREQALAEHLQSIRGHITNLSGKSYEDAEGVRSLDYVLLFIPVESAYMLALQSDKGEALFLDAMQRNIMLVSPATLLMALRTIHNIWRYEHQSQNAQEIARQAEDMHKKLVDFVSAMMGVGTQLQRAQDAYDTAFKRLKTGRGNLINRAQNIVKLGGIKPKKPLPEELLQQAAEADIEAVANLPEAAETAIDKGAKK